MFVDGGLRVSRLKTDTGEIIGEAVLDDRDPGSAERSLQANHKGLNMPVALPDILSSDGERLFMRSQVMDLEGRRLKLGPGGSGFRHLFAPYGFLDGSYFHRVYWIFGDSFQGGIGGFGTGRSRPAGRIMAVDKDTIFGYGRKPIYYKWSSVIDYHLYAAPTGRGSGVSGGASQKAKGKPKGKGKRKGKSGVAYKWTRDLSIMVRAMAVADRILFVAGPGDVLDEVDAFRNYSEKSTQEKLVSQAAALAGRSGANMQAVNADTGETLAEYKLDSPPVFDGLIVAGKGVYISTMDGRVISFVGDE
jgi:hypothetical protein